MLNSLKSKCTVLSFIISMGFFMQTQAVEPCYELVKLDAPNDHSFTVYENNDINKPLYYEVKLLNKTYGEGNQAVYYKWENNTLVECDEQNANITVKFDENSLSGRISSNQNGNDINATFKDLNAKSSGGAINMGISESIGDITGDFINNSAGNSGGAINVGGGSIGDIIGDFINNSAKSSGGAIDMRSSGSIGDITGDFINNSAGNSGGAIIISSSGSIGDITGDFINNSASDSGGAISSGGSIGVITGNFINNSVAINADLTEADDFDIVASSYGGAILNKYNASIGNIIGDFINNSAVINLNVNRDYGNIDFIDVYGGAIYNDGGSIGDITGDFINNSAAINLNVNCDHDNISAFMDVYGGAIYNYGSIGNITGDFINNSAVANFNADVNVDANVEDLAPLAYGGAIYNDKRIGNIIGDFINNSAVANFNADVNGKDSGAGAYGGAIYNYESIGNITGNFINNSATATSSGANKVFAYGGAIYNDDSIGNITGDFIYNSVTANSVAGYSEATGGAIFNVNKTSTIGNIAGNFINNSATATSSGANEVSAYGGAIYNDKGAQIGNILGNFINNSATANSVAGYSEATGGAIYNLGAIGDITGDFINNSVLANGGRNDGVDAYGGAIFNEDGTIGSKDSEGNVVGGIINSKFIGNHAVANKGTAKGGAIFTTGNLNIIADNGVSEFTGNYTKVGSVKDDNAIYLDSPDIKLSLITRKNGKIVMNDNIDGVKGYTVSVTGDKTGSLHLYNDIKNANVEMGAINLNTINNAVHNYNFDKFTLTDDINFAADVDLANSKMDRISAKEYGKHNGNINVVGMNILSEAKSDKTEILFADKGLKDNVVNKVSNDAVSAYSPIYKYTVSYDNRDNGGYYLFNRTAGGSNASYTSYNPSVLITPVATQSAATSAMNETVRSSFHQVDTFSMLPRDTKLAVIHNNQYAITEGKGVYSPDLDILNKSAWVQPYTSFESIHLDNGPKVDAITYGSLVGLNGNFNYLGKGWYGINSLCTGYNGLHLNQDGVSTDYNGGLLGMTETFYKGNFFNAVTASVGAGLGSSHTMYGKEDYTQLLAGLGNKFGYNFEFKNGKYIIQPALLMSYSFINTFDYTNAAGVKIDSDPLHSLNLNPSVKFIANLKNGWQPYASVGFVSNVLNVNKVKADNVVLPKMTVDPYVEYGVGLKRTWKDKFSGFLQAMVRSGGRNGVALSFGFKWSLGKDSL